MIQPIFSFFLTMNDNQTGKVILGGYDVSKYGAQGLTEKDIKWCSVVPKTDYFWTLSLNGSRLYGGKPIDGNQIFANMTLHSSSLIIDTGLSYALAPMADI